MYHYLDAIDTLFYALLARDEDGRYDWDDHDPAQDLPEWVRLTKPAHDNLPEDERQELELIAKVAGLIDISNRGLVDEILEEIQDIRKKQ